MQTIYESAKETAAKIRADLKRELPGVKFSVVTDGNAVSVAWKDAPVFYAVKRIVDSYESHSFDAMTDMSSTTGYFRDGVRYVGARFLSVSFEITEAAMPKFVEYARNHESDMHPWDIRREDRSDYAVARWALLQMSKG